MSQHDSNDVSGRNRLMGFVALLAAAALVAAAVGTYRVFSYLAVGLVVAVIGVSSIERNGSELDLSPYTGLVVGLGVVCATGFTGIWLLWNPSVTSYTYTMGLPQSTLVYFLFLWVLPIGGAFYYALVFPRIGGDDVVDDIMDRAMAIQRERSVPLSTAGGTGSAETDGGSVSGDSHAEGGEDR